MCFYTYYAYITQNTKLAILLSLNICILNLHPWLFVCATQVESAELGAEDCV